MKARRPPLPTRMVTSGLRTPRTTEFEEFSPTGKVIRTCGSAGSGEGQFNDPTGIAVNLSRDDVYVSDSGNNRIEVFSGECKFLEIIGAAGSWGALSHPMGLAFGSEVLMVTDSGNNRLVAFDSGPEGKFLASYGTSGSGEGQFADPKAIALGGVQGSEAKDFYVVDSGNNRVQEIEEQGGPTYKFVRQFGSKGAGEGQFTSPTAGVMDPSTGDVIVTDTGNNRAEEFPGKRYLRGNTWQRRHRRRSIRKTCRGVKRRERRSLYC